MIESPSLNLRQARIAVLAMFFINGVLLANWVSRIPQIQDNLELSEGALGLTLLGLSAGVLTALSAAGGLINRFGSRRITILAALVLSALLIPLAWMETGFSLWLGLFVFGMALSTMDVAMNAQAIEVEEKSGKNMMSTFHAWFSIGSFVGAAVGAGMAGLQIDPRIHFLSVALVFGVLILFFRQNLLPPNKAESSENNEPVFQLPARVVWPLGIVAFAGAIGEGAMADWSGVYLSNVIGTDDGTAALGFAVFSIMMTIGRLTGDRISVRFSPALLVRFGGLVAASGLLLAIFVPTTATTLIGFAAVGLGVATVVPLAFSAAGRFPGVSSSKGIAGVATIGYAGFLAGPPVIGLLAEATSLQTALLLVAALIATLLVTGQALNEARSPHFSDPKVVEQSITL